MTIAEDLESFRLWAATLGCPQEALPSDDALMSILKSPQRELFKQLQVRIRTRQFTQETRENILIHKVQNSRNKLVASAHRKFLPKELQRQLESEELQKYEEITSGSLLETEKEFDSLASIIKQKNLQVIGLEHKKQLLESKCNILYFKRESLLESCKREEDIKTRALASMPAKITSKNASELHAKSAVEQALKELEKFYNLCNENQDNANTLHEAKQRFWQKMRTIFANVPNSLLFNTIIRIKEEQLQHVIELNKKKALSDSYAISQMDFAVNEPLDNFAVKLYKTKADVIGIAAQYLNARSDLQQAEERFSTAYCKFVERLENKVKLLNTISDEEHADEIISDFLIQYNTRNFSIAQNEYLSQLTEQYRRDVEMASKELESHEILVGTGKQVYGEISTSINRIHSDMQQLTQIREKILYSRNLLKSMLDDIQIVHAPNIKANLLSSRLKNSNMSTSMMSLESFELANENVMCSTKLDFDCNASLLNATMQRSYNPGGFTNAYNPPTLPTHLAELNAFAEIPLERLRNVPYACDFYLTANPLITEGRELATTVQLAPGLLLTPHGTLEEVQRRILWASAIAEHTDDLKLNLDTLIVNDDGLRQQSKEQHDAISQLLDNIETITKSSKHTLKKIERAFSFILKNPLGQFIPPTKLYNNLPFSEYEQSFALYHRMATFGGSIK